MDAGADGAVPAWRRGWGRVAAALIAVLAVAAGWRYGFGEPRGDGGAPEIVEVRVGTETFRVEVARDDAAWRRGLSHRATLPPDGGMLFVRPDAKMLGFWMADTRVPLALAYLSDEGVIRETHEMAPESRQRVLSSLPARYALELPGGAFARAGAKPGDRVEGLPPARHDYD